jgi:hypothetical protein
MLRPKVVAEVGTLFAGTTETLARALWENGEGVVHTTDPFGCGARSLVDETPIEDRQVLRRDEDIDASGDAGCRRMRPFRSRPRTILWTEGESGGFSEGPNRPSLQALPAHRVSARDGAQKLCHLTFYSNT